MTPTLFDQLEKFVKTEFKDEMPHYMEWDFYTCDKDVLENDTQNNDTYLWIMKGETGTHLNRMSGTEDTKSLVTSMVESYCRPENEKRKFFWIECTGHNKGRTVETTRAEVMAALPKFETTPNREPRRKGVLEQLDDYVTSYRDTRQAYSIKLDKGANTFISIKPTRNNVMITQLCQETGKAESMYMDIVKAKTYQNTFIKIEATGSGYGKLQEISEKQFEKIKDRILDKTPKKTSEPALDR